MEPGNSTHRVEIVKIKLLPHPNADTLSVASIFDGGYTCVVKTENWKDGDLAAYIPPDSTVPTHRPEFDFLLSKAKADGRARIKAEKIRKVVSFGLLVKAPEGSKVGDDVAEMLQVEHYEPPIFVENKKGGRSITGAEKAVGPPVYYQKYDLESFRRFHACFTTGEPCLVSEKCDGSSSVYCYVDGKMYVGSHNEWKKEYPSFDHLTIASLVAKGVEEERAKTILEKLQSQPKKKNLWWEMLEKTPTLEKYCRDNPGHLVFGEIFGTTNRIKSGFPEGNRFAAFDIMVDGRWMDQRKFFYTCWENFVPTVPLFNNVSSGEIQPIPYDFDVINELATGNTLNHGAKAGTIREGVVVQPFVDRYDKKAGRVKLKCVSPDFLNI